jgi:hypothetical protein
MLDWKINALENESFLLLFDCQLNSLHLLGNNRQYFKLDSIEFIEADPASTRGISFEEFTHDKVIKLIRAIEHNTLSCKGLG